jgi:hypothetical protein
MEMGVPNSRMFEMTGSIEGVLLTEERSEDLYHLFCNLLQCIGISGFTHTGALKPQ